MPKKKNIAMPVVTKQLRKKTALANVWKSFIFTLIIGLQIAIIISYSYSLFRDKITAQQNIRDTLTYQGKIVNSDGVPPPDGLYDVSFVIYDSASAGNLLWTELWDSTDQDPLIDGNQGSQVNVIQGVFTVELNSLCGNWVGSCATGAGVTFDSDSLYLQVELDYDGNGTFEEVFTPRVRFTSTPYSMNADKFDGYDSTDFVQKAGANFSGPISAPGLVDSSLLGLFQFNSNNGTAIKNSALNGILDGTVVNDPGLSDNSLLLDGINQYATIADHDRLSFGNGTNDVPFSLSAWVYLLNTANFGILSKGTYNTNAEYRLFINADGKLSIQLFDLTVNETYIGRLYSTAVYPTFNVLGAWTQVAVTYDGSGTSGGLQLYINGKKVDDTDDNSGTYVAMHNDSGDLFFGRYESTYSQGKIDDVRIYSRELMPNEIIDLSSTERMLNLQASEIAANKLILRNLDYVWNQSLADESGNIQYDATLNRLVFSPEIFVPDNLPFVEDHGNSQDYTHSQDPGLLLAYDFSGSTGLKDVVGENNATATETAAQTMRGYYGYGFQFDAKGDQLSFSNPTLVAETGSVEVWVNPVVSAGSSDNYIVQMGEGSSNQISLAKISSVAHELKFAVGNSGLITAPDFVFTDSVWHHLALTWDNGTAKLYIDGVLNSTQSYGGLVTASFIDSYLGSAGTANTSFNGRLDSFALYSRVLTADDVINHYNSAFTSLYADNFKSGSLSVSLAGLNALPASENEKSKNDPVYFPHANKVLGLSFAEGQGTIAYSITGADDAGLDGAQWTKNGYFGYGMEFDGIDDELLINNSAALNVGSDSFSLEFYFKSDPGLDQLDNRIISKRDGDYGYEVFFDSSGKLTFFLGDGTNTLTSSIDGGFDLSDGKYHHFLLTVDRSGSGMVFYDSSMVEIQNISTITGSLDNTADLYIGRDALTDNFYKGTLDSVLIYKTVLGLADVMQRMVEGPSSLIVYGSNNVVMAPLISVNSDSSSDGLIAGILGTGNSSGYALKLLADSTWTDGNSNTIHNFIGFNHSSGTNYGNLVWDETNSQFVFDQNLKTTGDLTSNYLKTADNEFLAFDIIRHAITSDDVSASTFVEGWAKTTKDKIASLHGVQYVAGGNVYSEQDFWTANMENTLDFDGTNINVTKIGGTWAEGDVITIFIAYEK